MCPADLYAARLRKLYDVEEIGVSEFRCKNRLKCVAGASPRLLRGQGAESHVGSRYADAIRIVVISLDTGHGSQDLVERRRVIESIDCRRPPNPHMRGTIETLKAIFGDDVDLDSVLRYYAMINAAKCAANDGHADKVPTQLYDYCRSYAVDELTALDPQIIVAQGTDAKKVLATRRYVEIGELEAAIADFKAGLPIVMEWLYAITRKYLRVWILSARPVVVVETPHPSARQGQWCVFRDVNLPIVALIARRLLSHFEMRQ